MCKYNTERGMSLLELMLASSLAALLALSLTAIHGVISATAHYQRSVLSVLDSARFLQFYWKQNLAPLNVELRSMSFAQARVSVAADLAPTSGVLWLHQPEQERYVFVAASTHSATGWGLFERINTARREELLANIFSMRLIGQTIFIELAGGNQRFQVSVALSQRSQQ